MDWVHGIIVIKELMCTQLMKFWEVYVALYPFEAHCCDMDTAIKHPVLDRVKLSFVIFDIRALWRSGLSVRVPGCQKLQMTA